MLSFSLNRSVSLDLTQEMKGMIRHQSADDTASVYADNVGVVYLNMADPYRKSTVSKDVAAAQYINKMVWTTKAHTAKYTVPIISEVEEDEGVQGVPVNVLSFIEENLDVLADSDEFKSCMAQLYDMADIVELELDISLIDTLKSALKGNTVAIDCIKMLKTEYEGLGDVMYKVLSRDEWSAALC